MESASVRLMTMTATDAAPNGPPSCGRRSGGGGIRRVSGRRDYPTTVSNPLSPGSHDVDTKRDACFNVALHNIEGVTVFAIS
jgi:hypothetical protein